MRETNKTESINGNGNRFENHHQHQYQSSLTSSNNEHHQYHQETSNNISGNKNFAAAAAVNGVTGTIGGVSTVLPNSPRAKLAMLKRSSTKLKASAASSNDPFRFQGDGVDFKGKLIGVRDVDEARGDSMCADAMRMAKAAVKSSGQHKQRIILNISIEGLKIKDEKTQTILHNFPVSRISFIARDTTDARAFGFIYGCADNNYKFYGIKTAQTADRAVLSIRDMFQIVFEMKKAHLAEVKQKQVQQNSQANNGSDDVKIDDGVAVADLLDLESELHCIEQGYNQLQNIPAFAEDSWPTNDLFANTPNSFPAGIMQTTSDPIAFKASKHDPFDDSFDPRSIIAPVTTAPIVLPRPPPPAFHSHTPISISQQPQLSTWSQSDAFPPNAAFSETNPFISSATNVIAPSKETVDPFDTNQAQRVLQDASYHRHLSQQPVCWPSNENHIPSGGNYSRWTENKNVSSLEEAFSKLVDMDSLVSGPEIKKNPFEDLVNPPKVPISTLASSRPPCIPARTTAPLIVSTTANDPFNDEFFH